MLPVNRVWELKDSASEAHRRPQAAGDLLPTLVHEIANRLARILAAQEFDLDIPAHVIKTADCLQTLDDFSKVNYSLFVVLFISLVKVFDPSSDEPEAEQKRPHILIIDLAMVDQDNLVKTLRGRSKTPIVIAIGRDNEITPDCAEIFQ